MDNSTVINGILSSTNSTVDKPNMDPVLKKTFDILLISVMAVVMLSLGCTIDLPTLKKDLRRPIGIGIGMLCQFIIFPAVTFGLAHALQLKSWDALGMVMLGTCPGGSISNIATFWSAGDIALSVSMTAASTAVGTGMMPLNLWIYSRSWTKQSAVIPYVNIVIALVSILVPVAIGMVILYKSAKIAKWFARIGSTAGFLVIMGAVVVNIILYPEIYTSETAWGTWLGAALLPNVGLLIGYVLATICRLSVPQRRAISIETSAQNVALCLTLIVISFDKDTVSKMLTYPSLFGVFSVITLVLISLVFRTTEWRSRQHEWKVEKQIQPTTNDVSLVQVEKRDTSMI